MIQELTKLFGSDKLSSKHEIDRVYLYYVDNTFLRSNFDWFLKRNYYRTYYLRVIFEGPDAQSISVRLPYRKLHYWRERVAEINEKIYYKKVGLEGSGNGMA